MTRANQGVKDDGNIFHQLPSPTSRDGRFFSLLAWHEFIACFYCLLALLLVLLLPRFS